MPLFRFTCAESVVHWKVTATTTVPVGSGETAMIHDREIPDEVQNEAARRRDR